MKFEKIQGNGNDFVIIDDRNNIYLGKEELIAKKLCDRHFGIGADGVMFVRKSDISDIKMLIINADGSYAAMCGNGIRCFAKYVYDNNIVKKEELDIETGDGIKKAYLKLQQDKVKEVKIYMGKPSFNPKDIPVSTEEEIVFKNIKVNDKEYSITSLLMGVPHTVIFGGLNEYDVEEGKFIENIDLFPEKTNVNFCEIVDRNLVKVKTWERGAGATLACGTGSCACVVAAVRKEMTDKSVTVLLPGGKLFIEVCDQGVYMTGPAELTFKGETDLINGLL